MNKKYLIVILLISILCFSSLSYGESIWDDDFHDYFTGPKGDIKENISINNSLDEIESMIKKVRYETDKKEIEDIKDLILKQEEIIRTIEHKNDKIILNDRIHRLSYYLSMRQSKDGLHKSYIEGYEDGNVRPTSPVTREEAATIITRLSEKDVEAIELDDFVDVKKARWSYKDIMKAREKGYIFGYEDKSFKPTDKLTRAEAITILTRAVKHDEIDSENVEKAFNDIEGHWAEKSILSGVNIGWIEGYPDGSFRPDEYVKRCELVSLINKALRRGTSLPHMFEDRKEYKDLKKDRWYYEDMQEAINTHRYTVIRGRELWID